MKWASRSTRTTFVRPDITANSPMTDLMPDPPRPSSPVRQGRGAPTKEATLEAPSRIRRSRVCAWQLAAMNALLGSSVIRLQRRCLRFVGRGTSARLGRIRNSRVGRDSTVHPAPAQKNRAPAASTACPAPTATSNARPAPTAPHRAIKKHPVRRARMAREMWRIIVSRRDVCPAEEAYILCQTSLLRSPTNALTARLGMCVWERRGLRNLTTERSKTDTGAPKATIVRKAPIRKDHARPELTRSTKGQSPSTIASPANKALTTMLLVSRGARSAGLLLRVIRRLVIGRLLVTVLPRIESSLSQSAHAFASVVSDPKTTS